MPATLIHNIMARHKLPQNDAVLLNRSQLLDEPDQLLFKAILIYKQNAEQVSKLTGIKAHWIRRRIRQLAWMVSSKPFIHAMRAMPHMTPMDAQVAKLHYCQGLSHVETARRLGLTRYQLRRRLDRVRGLIATISQARQVSVSGTRSQERAAVLKLYPQGVFRCPTLKRTPPGRTA